MYKFQINVRTIGRWFMYCLAVVLALVTGLAFTTAIEIYEVEGSSMLPYYKDGDKVVVNKLAYLFDEPKVDDVAIFKTAVHTDENEKGVLMKRIAGTEGNVLKDDNGDLFWVTRGHIYVLGDSQRESLDSRNPVIGQLLEGELMGKVMYRLLTMDEIAGKMQEYASYSIDDGDFGKRIVQR